MAKLLNRVDISIAGYPDGGGWHTAGIVVDAITPCYLSDQQGAVDRVDWVWKICQVTVESNSNERQSKLSNKACLSFITLAAGSLPITGFSTILRF